MGLERDLGGYTPAPAPIWSPDNTWIAYLRWDGDGAQLWRVRRTGGAPEQLTRGDIHVRRIVYSIDGARIFYESEPNLEQIRAARAVEGRGGHLFDKRYYPGYSRTPVYPNAPVTPQLNVLDLESLTERLASETDRAEFKSLASTPGPALPKAVGARRARSPAGRFVWTEARDPARQGYRPPLTLVAQAEEAGQMAVCKPQSCASQSIRELWWRNDEEVIFLKLEGPSEQDTGLYSWKVRENKIRTILQTQGKVIGLLASTGSVDGRCGLASDRLICFYEEAARPSRVVAIDLDTGKIEILFDPNPRFGDFDLGPPPRRIDLRAPSGAAYDGVLILPPRQLQKRLPLVITSYRCNGFLRGGTGDEYPMFAFAAQGHAVLCLQMPEDFEQQARLDANAYASWQFGPGIPARRMFMENVKAAIDYLDERAIIDPNRVAITGLSAGSQLVGWTLAELPTLGAAIASSSPGTGGPMTYYFTPEDARAHIGKLYQLGPPSKAAQRWKELSFSAEVERVRSPLLINVADHEFMDALEPVAALRDAARSVEMFVFPNEFHWKWQPAHRLAIYNRNIDWMNFWLRGVESGLTGDTTQYMRWRAMRENQCKLFGPDGTARKTGEDPPWYCLPGALKQAGP